MSDILLSVGLQKGTSEVSQIQTDLQDIISRLDKNPPKVMVGLQVDQSALNHFKSQLTQIVNSVGLSKGAPITVNISGLGEISAQASAAKQSLDEVAMAGENAASSVVGIGNGIANSAAILEENTDDYRKAMKRVNDELVALKRNQEKWTAAKHGRAASDYEALGQYERQLEELAAEFASNKISMEEFTKRFNDIKSSADSSRASIKRYGEDTKSFGDRLKGLAEKFSAWLSVSQVIMMAVRAIKQMVQSVRDVDKAMTELKKVTNETGDAYNRFLENASVRAQQIGASLSDAVNASADFARLGYGLEDAVKLADAALIYKNIGDGIEDVTTASESIISTMQAFGVEASNVMSIVDKFNEVGNNFAISSAGIGEAMKRSSAAMAAANNTIDETIALITAANTIVQNPDSVGTAMKTVSMYLRAAKTEAEEAGESTEGMANSVSELREAILNLTGQKVDIQIDEDTFKSTYQILKELSSVWDNLTDVSRANILELIGGKRNANVVSALLDNFTVAEQALTTAAQSAGSAMEENEKQLESIEGKIAQFKAAFQTFSQNLIGSDTVKLVVDIGTALIKVMDALQKVRLLLPTIIALSAAFKGIGLAKNLNMITTALITNKAATESLAISVSKLTKKQKLRLVEDIKAAVATNTLTKEQGAQILTTLGLATADGALTIANRGLAASFKSLMASIPVWGWIALGISVVIEGVLALTSAVSSSGEEFETLNTEFEQTISEMKTLSDNFSNLKSNLDDTVPRFVELASGVNKLGENVSLTDEQYEEFLQLNNKIAEMFPELNLGMDENGNYMLALAYSSDTLKNSLYELLEAQRLVTSEEIAKNMPTVLDDIVKIEKDYRDEIRDIEADMNSIKKGSFKKTTSGDRYSAVDADTEAIEAYNDYIQFLQDKGIAIVDETVENIFGTTGKVYTATWDATSSQAQNAIAGYEKEIDNLEAKIKSKWKRANASINAWLQSDFLYNDMGSNMQDIAKAMVSGMDFSDLGLVGDSGEATAENIKNYITKYIINPLYSASPAIQDALESAMSELASGDITTDEFASKIKEAFDSLLADMDESEIENFKKLFIAGFNARDIEGNTFAAVVANLIAEWSKMPEVVEDSTDSVNKFVSAISSVESLSSGLDQLGKIYADVFNKEDFDWSSILGNEDFTNAFGSLGDAYDDFIKTVANAPDDISACQDAFDKLATAYISNSDALAGVTDETRNATIAMLEQMGIANAASIVDARLAYNKELLRIQTILGKNATDDAINAMLQEQEAGSLTEQVLAQLAITKLFTNETDIRTVGDIEQLEGLAKSANATEASLLRVAQAKALMAKAEKFDTLSAIWKPGDGFDNYLSYVEQADAARKEAQELLSKPLEYNEIDFSKYKVQYSGGGETSSAKGKSGNSKEETWFEKQLSMHQHLVAMNQETQEAYLTWLNSAYKRAYDEGIINLNDYYKYTEEVYQGLQDLFRDYLSDVEHEISMRENYDGEAKKIIELYDGLIERVEKEIADARARGLTDEDDYIQELQKKWQDYTGSIEDLRDEITESAKDALDELIDYRVDMLKQEIEDEKDALDERLDNLKDFYDKQKEMLQDRRDEENYLKDQSDKRKTVTDLQAELDMLENDDSAWAQKRKLELKEEIATAQEDLDEFEKDHALGLALDALDKAYNDQEAQLQAEMDALEEKLNDPEALYNKALEDIRKNSENQLYYQMLMYNKQFGDGRDDTVKELWELAFGALSDYEKLFGELYQDVKLGNETGVENDGGWDDEKISGTNPENQKPTTNPPDSTTTETPKSYPYGKASDTTGNIGVGANGTKVKAIQYALNELGFGNSGTADCDGIFGSGTQKAVKAFQSAMGIRSDGIVGKDTRAKLKAKGYASGTDNATPGWHEVNELGAEYLFVSPSDGTRYRMFTGGEKVLNADATDFLYQFANSGGTILTKMLADLFGHSSFGNVSKPMQAIEIHSGNVIVQGNATERTVSEIRRAQRDNLEFVLKELNRLNK